MRHTSWRTGAAWLAALVFADSAVAGGTVSGGLSRDLELARGQSASGTIELVADAAGWTGRIYLADFLTDAAGRRFPDAGTNPRTNAGWITIETGTVTVAPHERRTLAFTAEIPRDDALTGSYWSAVMLEEAAPPASGGGLQIAIVNRVAVRIATHVLGTGEPRLEFLHEEVQARGDARVLVTEVRNVGERASRTELGLTLTDADGRVVEAAGTEAIVFPGCSAQFEVVLPALRPGDYVGLMVAEPEVGLAFGKRVALSYDLWGAPMETP